MNCCLKGNFNPITLKHIQLIKEKLESHDEIYLKIDNINNHKINMINISIKNIDNVYIGDFDNYINISDDKIKDFKNLDKNVISYIFDNCLYYDEIVKQNLSEKRFNHSKSVANLCKELAIIHNINPNKAYIAGILHDIFKEKSFEENKKIVQKNYPDLIDDEKSYLYHGYCASIFARENLYIEDEEILEAIFHHTTGNGQKTLSKILFIADKIDPLRNYDSSKEYELSKKDLDLAVKKVKENQIKYLKER